MSLLRKMKDDILKYHVETRNLFRTILFWLYALGGGSHELLVNFTFYFQMTIYI